MNNWDEFTVREAIYSKNKVIAAHSNADPANHYKLGDTQFSDWSDAEFMKLVPNMSLLPTVEEYEAADAGREGRSL